MTPRHPPCIGFRRPCSPAGMAVRCAAWKTVLGCFGIDGSKAGMAWMTCVQKNGQKMPKASISSTSCEYWVVMSESKVLNDPHSIPWFRFR